MSTESRLEPDLQALTDALLRTYDECGSIDHLGQSPLPSFRSVVDILGDLQEVLYPGYGRRQNLNKRNVAYHVGDLLDSLHGRLTEQIARALKRSIEGCEPTDTSYAEQASELSYEFLVSLPDLRKKLADDVRAAYDGDPAAKSFDEIVFCYPGLTAISTYRVAHRLINLGVPLIPRMMTEYAHSKTGVDIHPGAKIGPRFFIDHGTGVVIGETTEIGSNVKIYQGVTLGALSFPRDEKTGEIVRDAKRHPTIEDDVVIYANATILGGRTVIGHHSVIGSSVWITRSVEPHTVVTIESPRLRIKGSPEQMNGVIDYQI